MVQITLKCPQCESENIKKAGKSTSGKQRYSCKDCRKSFQEGYVYNGYNSNIVPDIYFQTINGSGIRAITRNLNISQQKVISTFRSFEAEIWHVNYAFLENLDSQEIEIGIVSETELEMDEMWSFVHDKSQQYWLWWVMESIFGNLLLTISL